METKTTFPRLDMFISAVIGYSNMMDSLLDPVSSGRWRNCSFLALEMMMSYLKVAALYHIVADLTTRTIATALPTAAAPTSLTGPSHHTGKTQGIQDGAQDIKLL